MKQHTLGRSERLKSRKKIEQLFQSGNSFSEFPFKVYWRVGNSQSLKTSTQFGIGVGTRNFKKAVDRNRIKRLTREAYRLQKKDFEKSLASSVGELSVFFIYTGKELPAYDLVRDKMALIFQKLRKLLDELAKANT